MIALPPDWANYGEIMRRSRRSTGSAITNDNPDGSSAQENQAIVSLKGDSRAPDVVDVGPSFAIAGRQQGLYAKYFNTNCKTIPRAMKDTRGYWMGDYWGAISIGYNTDVVSTPPKTFGGPAEARVQEQGRAQRQPAHLELGGRRACSPRRSRNGGSLDDVGPGIDFFANAEDGRATSSRCRRRRRRSRPARRRSRSTGTTTTSPT